MNLLRAISVMVLFSPVLASAAASFIPNYTNDPGEGFFDNGAPHAQSMADGNPGATLGEQRQWAFEKALEFWGLRLDSNVTIVVDAAMDDLTCSSSSAILGSAGTNFVHANWPANGGNPPAFADTWYGEALANRIANRDLSGSDDIGATFNKRIDESDNCLGSNVWYYALGNAPSGTASFFKTVLHEIGHGINVQTFVDLEDGSLLGSNFTPPNPQDDIYMRFLEDHSTATTWDQLEDQGREDSAIDTNDLHWIGTEVLASIGSLGDGTSNNHVEMYAPDPLELGSSVSHWDMDVDDNSGNSELMEPSATGTEKLTVTDEMLHDMGWNDVPAGNCTFSDERISDSERNINSTITHEACVSVTLGSNLVVTSNGSLDVLAGHQVFIRDGFGIEIGGTLSIDTDPGIGL